MKVKNIKGTSEKTCNCGSWLDHWTKFSGQQLPQSCREIRCAQKPEVGAHVQKADSTDSKTYIVPLCKTHNAETDKTLEIMDSTVLVSANISETCGK